MELLIALALGLLIVGTVLLVFWPMLPISKQKSQSPSVTVTGAKGIVTVRNAAGGDVSVFFGTSASDESEHIIPSRAASDPDAEKEVTILDELRNPDTAPERKAEIETELLALGYRIVTKPKASRSTAKKPVGTPVGASRPERKPSSAKPSEPDDSDNDTNHQDTGSDEGLGEQEPSFESFHIPSD